MTDPHLDKAGAFLIGHLRDRAIRYAEGLLAKKWKAPAVADLQARAAALTPEQAAIARSVTAAAIDAALHDFLFALSEASAFQEGIELRCDGVNVAPLSDGLQGELYGDTGWIARFSGRGGGADAF